MDNCSLLLKIYDTYNPTTTTSAEDFHIYTNNPLYKCYIF